jgi:hypothetical protein
LRRRSGMQIPGAVPDPLLLQEPGRQEKIIPPSMMSVRPVM